MKKVREFYIVIELCIVFGLLSLTACDPSLFDLTADLAATETVEEDDVAETVASGGDSSDLSGDDDEEPAPPSDEILGSWILSYDIIAVECSGESPDPDDVEVAEAEVFITEDECSYNLFEDDEVPDGFTVDGECLASGDTITASFDVTGPVEDDDPCILSAAFEEAVTFYGDVGVGTTMRTYGTLEGCTEDQIEMFDCEFVGVITAEFNEES